jgi:hypothetical protein
MFAQDGCLKAERTTSLARTRGGGTETSVGSPVAYGDLMSNSWLT